MHVVSLSLALARLEAESAIGSLIGRLLPRVMLKEHGIPPKDMTFAVTAAKKPYIVILPPAAVAPGYD